MLYCTILNEGLQAHKTAELLESKDKFKAAEVADSHCSSCVKLAVQSFYGAMPKHDSYGRLIIPQAILEFLQRHGMPTTYPDLSA